MSVLDDRELYKNDSYLQWHEVGDYTPFYVAITICSVIGGFLIILNVALCWCSQHRTYWRDRHTGNRWIQSLWVVTPHNNPPLDLSELESKAQAANAQYFQSQLYYSSPGTEDVEAHYPQSDVTPLQRQEYMEMHKRESDI